MNQNMQPASLDWRSIADVRLIALPHHTRSDGGVVVAEAPYVPFTVARMFAVTALLGTERGKHAHKFCSQFMVCVHGTIEIICDDGADKRSFTLDRPNLALLVPPTIWNTVIYRQEGAVLTVLCDRIYEPDDYFHEYSEFIAMRKAAGA